VAGSRNPQKGHTRTQGSFPKLYAINLRRDRECPGYAQGFFSQKIGAFATLVAIEIYLPWV